jgi:hypothetical protein
LVGRAAPGRAKAPARRRSRIGVRERGGEGHAVQCPAPGLSRSTICPVAGAHRSRANAGSTITVCSGVLHARACGAN